MRLGRRGYAQLVCVLLRMTDSTGTERQQTLIGVHNSPKLRRTQAYGAYRPTWTLLHTQ